MISAEVLNKRLKYALFLLNFLYVIFGIVFISLGTTAVNAYGRYLPDDFSTPPKLFVATGFILTLIAFLGLFGTYTDNHSVIVAYFVLAGLIVIAQSCVGMAAYFMESELESFRDRGLTTMNEYNNDTYPDIKELRRSWDLVQSELQCCGWDNYTDWKNVRVPHGSNHPLIPESCCLVGSEERCTEGINESNLNYLAFVESMIYTRGCHQIIVQDITITRIGALGTALSVLIEIAGVVCAWFFARSIRIRRYDTVQNE